MAVSTCDPTDLFFFVDNSPQFVVIKKKQDKITDQKCHIYNSL